MESLIRDQQPGYYAALNEANRAGASTPFIAFMLQVIHNALAELAGTPQVAPQVAPQVTPQVKRLLTALDGEMDRAALQAALDLTDRKSFRERYLHPALEAGLIEMTRPDKPNSRLQRYCLTALGLEVRRSCG